MKVTLVPAQILLPGLAVMLTAGVTFAVTVMVMALEVDVAGTGQGADDESTHVMTSPVASEAFE